MREFFRLLILFLLASAALIVAFGTGFSTGNQLADVGAVNLPDVLEERRGSLAGLVGGSDVESGAPSPDASEGTEPEQDENGFAVFWDAWRVVHDEYRGELPEDETLTYGAIRGSLRVLDDPYTLFTDPVLNEVRRVELEGEFQGIGAFVAQNAEEQLVIQTPMRGQPAEKAGILAGDIVLAVDGVEITGMDVNEAVLLIRGEKGTAVVLTISREDLPEPFDVSVIRDRIDIPSVSDARVLTEEGAPEVGYIELTVFASETRAELAKAIAEVREAGARAIILDLRNNPGGFLNAAVGVTSEFIDEGVVTYREDSKGTRRAERVVSGGSALDMPLVVLINRGSASASEIVAGAVRDYERGVIVGERSFGKGSVQNVHDLSDGSQLRVTVEHWLTPNGETIQGDGVLPDVIVTPEPRPTPAPDMDAEGVDAEAAPDDESAGEGDAASEEGDTPEADAEPPPDAQLDRAIVEALALLSSR